jgi:hypothetical protein
MCPTHVYRPPRINDDWFQARVPDAPGGRAAAAADADAAATAAAGPAAKRRQQRVVPTCGTRIRDACARITAASALASKPVHGVWDAEEAARVLGPAAREWWRRRGGAVAWGWEG